MDKVKVITLFLFKVNVSLLYQVEIIHMWKLGTAEEHLSTILRGPPENLYT